MHEREHTNQQQHTSKEGDETNRPLAAHHAYFKKLYSIEEIGNYGLWYSSFEQKSAVSDFEFLKASGKTPILVVKQRWDNGVRLPFICPVNEIGKICMRTKEDWKRHFFEVSNKFCCDFIFVI